MKIYLSTDQDTTNIRVHIGIRNRDNNYQITDLTDGDGLIHLKASLYIKATKVNWALMVNDIYKAGPDDL